MAKSDPATSEDLCVPMGMVNFRKFIRDHYEPAIAASLTELKSHRKEILEEYRHKAHIGITTLRREAQDEAVGVSLLTRDAHQHLVVRMCPWPWEDAEDKANWPDFPLLSDNARFTPGKGCIFWVDEHEMQLRLDLVPSCKSTRVMTVPQVNALRETVPASEFAYPLANEQTTRAWALIRKIAQHDDLLPAV